MKSSTNKDLQVQASQQLFTLDRTIKKFGHAIEDIGDYIPGNLMVQDLNKLHNEYMNQSGCEILMHDQDELRAIGTDYYKKFFPTSEITEIIKGMQALHKRQDTTEVLNFFQRVRPNENSEYKWYFTISKLYQDDPTKPAHKIIHIANEVNTLGPIASKVHRLLEEGDYIKHNFKKFMLLTKREKEIITLLVEGKHSSDIAGSLFISPFTVNTHRRNINSKLQIKSFAGLVKFAMTFELV